jgi:hypothetical protein
MVFRLKALQPYRRKSKSTILWLLQNLQGARLRKLMLLGREGNVELAGFASLSWV